MNESYDVKVIKMLDFGAVVEYQKLQEMKFYFTYLKLAWERTENVSDVVNMGDVFQVKYLGMDPNKKRKVSRKHLCQDLHVRKEKSNQILVY
jgi:polyribonucleotide nucleotidyltransferase